MKKRTISVLLLVVMLVNLLAIPAQALTTEYHINFNEEKKLYLTTSKSVTKTEWSTNNPAVVDIVDENLLSCTVVGVDNQRGQSALITCHYWYLLAGTIFQDYEYFRVYVPEDDGNSTGNPGSSGRIMYAVYHSVSLDLASSPQFKNKVWFNQWPPEDWHFYFVTGDSDCADVDIDVLEIGEDSYTFNIIGKEVGRNTVTVYFFGDGRDIASIPIQVDITCSHNWEMDAPSIAPTCTEEGLITGKTCTACGEKRNIEKVVPAQGHNYGGWEIYQQPTADTEGFARQTCSCGKFEEKTIGAGAVSIDPETGITDIAAGEWYYDAVSWAVEKGITTGTSDSTFTPAGPCTRGQAVTFLYRAAGCPEYKTESNPFTDVREDDYYYDAVMWAVEKGITNGTSNTTFSPDGTCTRGQIVTLLWRWKNTPAGEGENPFGDVNADAYYADAVLWAVEKGITNGMTESAFAPDNHCTRAQIVTFLHRAKEIKIKPRPLVEPTLR